MIYRDGEIRGLDGDIVKPRAIQNVRWYQRTATEKPTPAERAFMVLMSPVCARSVRVGAPVRYVKQIIYYVTDGISFRSDFVFKKQHLIVEIDGPDHAKPAQRERDEWRDRVLLETRGLRTLRISNDDALRRPLKARLQVVGALLDSACGKQREFLAEYHRFMLARTSE